MMLTCTCCCFGAARVSREGQHEERFDLSGFSTLARFHVCHSGTPDVMHKVDYRALEKMAREFHGRQLNETYSFENLLLEKENKNISFSCDVNPCILLLSLWDELYIVLILFQLEYCLIKAAVWLENGKKTGWWNNSLIIKTNKWKLILQIHLNTR